mmetsp:Transcript_11423/g.17689  ORF Transcript_11423/g.17689 Transcript_11423/m.17689 type:complete len:371 (+) Transcript_11423:68-1180(+)
MKISSLALFRVSSVFLAASSKIGCSAFNLKSSPRQLALSNFGAACYNTPPAFLQTSCRFLQTQERSKRGSHLRVSASSDNEQRTTSMDFAIDPHSDEEARLLTTKLGLNDQQHEKLVQLSSLVVEWNDSINLISRKDCTESVVFGRHIMPSLAVGVVPLPDDQEFASAQKVVDVGTGGGFPGLPLAIAYPDTNFLLVDSVGKKLTAVQAMADELGLQNVKTHHGRAEELVDDVVEGSSHKGAYDICLGRSVAALPKFCFWISDLLQKEGQLLYIIGGPIDESVESKLTSENSIDDLLEYEGASDKRVLVFGQKAVAFISAESGEVKQKRGSRNSKNKRSRNKKVKGAWAKKDNSAPKQRGYEGFKRFEIN